MTVLLLSLFTISAALDVGQEHFLRKAESGTPNYEASSTLRVQLYITVVMCAIFLAAALIFFWTSTPANEKKEVEEEEVPGEPAPEPAAENSEAPDLGPALEDYEDLVRMLLQRGTQSMAPKVAKAVQVASIISDRVSSLTTKAKALVVTELTDTVGSIAQSLQLEEFMLLLDDDAALAANVPPVSVLLAGLLVPANLNFTILCHLLQVVLVLIPVLAVAAVSEYVDWNHSCASIPGLRLWARTVGALAGLIALARVLQALQCFAAKAQIRRKNDEMKEKLEQATSSPSASGLEELKQLFVFYAATLQHALSCEARIRANVFSHIVGFGTLLWLLTTFWNLWLYFGYMFVPGVVAFHEAAAGESSYCGAWVTACAAKISILLALMFFFGNVLTVFFWLSETTLSMDRIAEKIVAHAKAFDQLSLGLPVAQVLVKAVLLRGSTDILCARLASQMREKDGLSQELAATEQQLAKLKSELEAKDQEVEVIKAQMLASGGSLAAQAERITAGNFDAAKAHGEEVLEEAKRKVAMLEQQTGEEIEKMLVHIKAMMDKAAMAAEEARIQARAVAAQAATAAGEAANKASAYADDAKKQVAAAAEAAQGSSFEEARAAASGAAKKMQNLVA
ncbi:unnamed protein product [Effrenium voratum]|nr:unnamed protein product [Effrenium voratum]